MRKIIYPGLLILIILVLVGLRFEEQRKNLLTRFLPGIPKPLVEKEVIPDEPFEPIGERIVYAIKLGKVSLGAATYTHLPRVELNGVKVSMMTFKTTLVRFNDLEKIYSDSKSFLPLQVERSISTWPSAEKISEEYDQENFILTIIKNKGKAKQSLVIKKDGPIHNAILLPFYVRRMDKLEVGWSMKANLPNQQFEIKLVAIEEVKVPAGSFRAYRFESVPPRFEIWITSDERKIPIMIKGAGALGYTLLMKEYSI